jgi:hypothetical protein
MTVVPYPFNRKRIRDYCHYLKLSTRVTRDNISPNFLSLQSKSNLEESRGASMYETPPRQHLSQAIWAQGKPDCFTLLTRCVHVMANAVMWTAVAIFLFLCTSRKAPTTMPVWRSCQIGGLECLEAVFFDQRYELMVIFVIALCLFLWILRPKARRSMELWHGRQAPDAICQKQQVVREDGRKKHVAHVLSPSFALALERPIMGGGLHTSFSRSEGSLALPSQKSASPIVKVSFSRSLGSLLQQGQKPACFHSRTSRNLRGVLQGQKLALSHSPERMLSESRIIRREPAHSQSPDGKLKRQEPATVYSSGTHFYTHVIAHQSVK